MTRSVFSEVMGYFISQSLYLETKELSPKAASIIEGLGDIEDDLIERIRPPLVRMHRINLQRNFDVELNYKKPAGEQRVAKLDTMTATNLTQSKVKPGQVVIKAVITRFNARTGNGRLVIEGDDDTIAFGFYMPLKSIPAVQKRMISLNLHNNNGRHENYTYLKLTVNKVVVKSGEVVKYLIRMVDDV